MLSLILQTVAKTQRKVGQKPISRVPPQKTRPRGRVCFCQRTI